jgi:hypothetical protein
VVDWWMPFCRARVQSRAPIPEAECTAVQRGGELTAAAVQTIAPMRKLAKVLIPGPQWSEESWEADLHSISQEPHW